MVRLRRFDIHLIHLDPTVGSEIQKTRPCVIVSPDEINRHLRTVIVAPLTSATKTYPTRVATDLDGRPGQIALDQIRTLDRRRFLRRLGRLTDEQAHAVLTVLQNMFAR